MAFSSRSRRFRGPPRSGSGSAFAGRSSSAADGDGRSSTEGEAAVPGGDHEGDGNQEGRPAAPSRRRVERTPVQTALGLLTRREHSRRELASKLAARGVEPTEAEAAIGRLTDAGWQDDGRFAASLVRMRVAAGYGPIRIRAELATHGLDREAVHQAMELEPVDWQQAACELARRRFGAAGLRDAAQRRCAADFLIRRGFPSDAVRAATQVDPAED